MPYNPRYKKRTYKKRTWRRKFKAKTRRQIVKPKFGGRVQQPVHYFTRFHTYGQITGLNGTDSTKGSMVFKLTDVPNWQEFQALYDSYKLKAVKVSFIPVSNVTLGNSVPLEEQTSHLNRIYTVFDYNDKTVPSTLNSLREYQNCRWGSNNRVHKRFLYPKPLMTISEGGGSYGVAQFGKSPWISMASDQTEFYGIKYGIQHTNLHQDVVLYGIEVKYYLAFKARK